MDRAADVRSIDALKDAKAALVEFREIIGVALAEAYSDVQRTLWWLQHDQRMFWQGEKRRRAEKVAQAKSELYRAQLAAMDHHAACAEQRKLLKRAEAALEEAERKIKLVKKWSTLIDREMMIFRAALQPISRSVEAEIPLGEARLVRMAEQLEAYVRLRMEGGRPAPDDDEPADEGDDTEQSS
jgi:hypothetical protein